MVAGSAPSSTPVAIPQNIQTITLAPGGFALPVSLATVCTVKAAPMNTGHHVNSTN